jgi:hypothetical protein
MPAAPSPPRALAKLERWFQAGVLRPHVRKRAAAAAPAERHLLPSRTLSAAERLAIYQRAYLLRLEECLQADFPAVRRIAGDARFSELARAYLERHPSRHWSLNPLGRAFERFLAREAPRGPRIALLSELARLEWALQVVFEAPPSPTLAEGALARIAPGDWARRRLVPIGALQLFAFEHRCNAIAGSVRRGEPLPPLGRQRTWVAVYRKDWTVWRMDLDRLQFELLSALCRGRTLSQALAAAARGHRGSQAELAQRVQAACASFVSEGFFSAVR